MRLSSGIVLTAMIACLCAYSVGHAQTQGKFKLKPDAGGRQCLTCHDSFKGIMSRPFIHTPVKTGQCTGCHDPHTASHGKLLAEEPNKICIKCHKGILPASARSSHKVAMEGNCVKCHDPHGSANKFNLLKGGNSLCFDCHKAMGEALAKVKFKHSPVEKGCTNCHDPHASAKTDHLLKNDPDALCTNCHKTNGPNFSKQHMGFPVGKSRCTSCHDPHGSDRSGILFNNVHAPVEKKMCSQCHDSSNTAAPLTLKKTGLELCKGCHAAMIKETLGKKRLHWPLADQVSCLHCHEPHASPQKKLLAGDSRSVCGKCHRDTMQLQERLSAKEKEENLAVPKGEVVKGALTHQPVQEGNCAACHAPHSSDNVLLMRQPSVVELCGTCHDWLKHTSHPMGEKARDQRNKNLTVDCLSCHKSHGTGYRHLLPFPAMTDLCVQCHKQYRR